MSSLTNKNFRRPHSQSGGINRFVGLGILVVWLLGLSLVAANRQSILDWWQLRNYHAPAAVAQLAIQDTMTDYGRNIFYVNHPLLEDNAQFAGKCPVAGGEQTIVLGCYINGPQYEQFKKISDGGIFLLSVNDPRLEGVVQVTAAHEMLHGAYDRLRASERTKVDAMLMDYYKHQLKDQRILDTIDAYKKSEPNDVVNEMHSVFGTEISSLPAPLEQYYRRYFTNRAQVAAFAAQYQLAFTSRKLAITNYDKQLAALKAQITSAQDELKSKHNDIEARQASLVNLRSSGNIAAYNAGVPIYNSLVDAYNREVGRIKDLISQYNQLVNERNAVVLEQGELSKELTSDVAPIQH